MTDDMVMATEQGTVETATQHTPWYEQPMSLSDIRTYISANFQSIKRAFVAIGFYLKRVERDELYLEDGYNSIWDFAQAEYGLNKSSASRYMSICSRFSVGGNSPNLQDKYQAFDKSKLQEMLSLTDEQLEQVTPDMRVEDIRGMKPQKEKAYNIPYFELEGQLEFGVDFPDVLPDTMAAPLPEIIPPLPQQSFVINVSDLIPAPEGSVAISQQPELQTVSVALQSQEHTQDKLEPGDIIDGEFAEIEEQEKSEELAIAKAVLEDNKQLLEAFLSIEGVENAPEMKMQKIIVCALENFVYKIDVANPRIMPEDCIGYADYLKIVFDNKCIEVFPENDRYLDYTFGEVMQEAKQNGWKDGTILLIAETPLSGKIYQYGNYGDFWVEHGTTRGYA